MSSTQSPRDPAEASLIEELRELGQSVAAMGRAAFKSGRVLSIEGVRAARKIVDRAREELEKLAREKDKK